MTDSAGTRRVFIHRNEASAEGKVLLVSDDISLSALKKLGGDKLGLKKVKKIYIANGAEVVSVDEIQQNENLYFSTEDGFYRASISGSGAEKINVAVLGDGGVGKSAITLRFVRDFFIKNWEATIEDAYRKTIRVSTSVPIVGRISLCHHATLLTAWQVDDEVSVLEILDTAGQEDFSTLRTQWMMDKDGYAPWTYNAAWDVNVDSL